VKEDSSAVMYIRLAPRHLSPAPCILTIQVYESGSEPVSMARPVKRLQAWGTATAIERRPDGQPKDSSCEVTNVLWCITQSNQRKYNGDYSDGFVTSYMYLSTEVAPCERATFYIKLLHLRLWY